MTRQRNDKHGTPFGNWLRMQESIDSRKGWVASNLDYIWSNYNTGDWMLIEEKRYGARLTFCQTRLFDLIDKCARQDAKYHGFHTVRFQNTTPDDGLIWIDDAQADKARLLAFLRFETV